MDHKHQQGLKLWNAGKSQECANIWMDLADYGHLDSIEQLVYIFLNQKEFEEVARLIDCAKNPNEPIILYLKARLIEERDGIDAAMGSFYLAAEAGSPNSCLFMFAVSIEEQSIEDAKFYLSSLAEHSDYLGSLGKPTSYKELEERVEELIAKLEAAKESELDEDNDNDERLGVETVNEVSEWNEEMEFRNDDLRYPYMDYLSGDEEKIATIEDKDPELFQMFEELDSYEFLTLWGDWSMDFEHPFSDEAWEKVSYQLGFLIHDLEDELSEEQLEQFDGYPKRLSVRDDFLPTSESPEYKFNIEGGVCSISAKAPQLPPDSDDQGYDDSSSLKGHTGIDCDKHEDSKECYLHKCDANLITLASGFGDGVYGVTCFDNWQGEVECVIAYFYHDHEYVEKFIIENDFEAPGFIEGYVPFYLGRLSSNGEFYFGDSASWTEGRDEGSWSLARVEVPADEYLVLGWIDPRTSFDRVFFVGLYRNVMKSYLEKVMDFYPATKTFADDHIMFEHGGGELG